MERHKNCLQSERCLWVQNGYLKRPRRRKSVSKTVISIRLYFLTLYHMSGLGHVLRVLRLLCLRIHSVYFSLMARHGHMTHGQCCLVKPHLAWRSWWKKSLGPSPELQKHRKPILGSLITIYFPLSTPKAKGCCADLPNGTNKTRNDLTSGEKNNNKTPTPGCNWVSTWSVLTVEHFLLAHIPFAPLPQAYGPSIATHVVQVKAIDDGAKSKPICFDRWKNLKKWGPPAYLFWTQTVWSHWPHCHCLPKKKGSFQRTWAWKSKVSTKSLWLKNCVSNISAAPKVS